MSTISVLSDRRGQLVVSLPANDVDLAREAIAAGADVIKVHCNLTHVSGHDFGSFADNRDVFEQIIDLGVPVGLVPGATAGMVTHDEVREAIRLGFAFFNVDISAAPAFFTDPTVPFIPSGGGTLGSAEYLGAGTLRGIPGQWMEASGVVGIENHRKPLTVGDILGLRGLGEATGRRLIVPSVRQLNPDDLPWLFAVPSVWAVMIGAYVTGLDRHSLADATHRFRTALDQLELADPSHR